MRKITANTKLFSIIGDPIDHSLSPILHNKLYELLDIDAAYLPVLVKPGQLLEFIRAGRMFRLSGFNVTMPHKMDMVTLADHTIGNRVGSVNTVRIEEDGTTSATSTDGPGFMDGIKRANIKASGRDVMIIGAGGVVRPIAYSLSYEGSTVLRLVNRTFDKAKAIAYEMQKYTNVTAKAYELDMESLSECAARSDIIINATPEGMMDHPVIDDFSFLKDVKKTAVIVDTVYSKAPTEFEKQAEKHGIQYISGFGMLIGQAFESHKFWFGTALGDDIYDEIEKTLKGELQGV